MTKIDRSKIIPKSPFDVAYTKAFTQAFDVVTPALDPEGTNNQLTHDGRCKSKVCCGECGKGVEVVAIFSEHPNPKTRRSYKPKLYDSTRSNIEVHYRGRISKCSGHCLK